MKLVRGASSACLEHGVRAQRRRQLLALEYDVEAWGRRPLDRSTDTLARGRTRLRVNPLELT